MLRKALVGAVSCAALAAAAAPAAAELRDVRVGVEGDRAEITIAFDAAPTGTSAAPGGGGIVVFASGVAASPRRIETAGASLVRFVDVRAGEGGIELDLELTSEAAAARAWVEGGVLRIAVTLAGVEGAPALAASPGAAASGAPTAGAAQVAGPQSFASQNVAVPGAASAASMSPTAAPPATAGSAPGAAPSTVAPTVGASTAAGSPFAGSAAVPPGVPPGLASAAPTGAPTPQAASATAGATPQGQATASASPPAVDALMTAPAPANAIVAPPLRQGGETAPNAANADPVDAISPEVPAIEPNDSSAPPPPPRDAARPSVIYAGGVTEEECDAADTAVRADPWDLDSLKRYAGCRAVDGDLSGAESAFRRLLTIMPDDAEAELGLAAVLHEKGDVAAAAAIYDRQLANANGDAQAARLRALVAVAASGR